MSSRERTPEWTAEDEWNNAQMADADGLPWWKRLRRAVQAEIREALNPPSTPHDSDPSYDAPRSMWTEEFCDAVRDQVLGMLRKDFGDHFRDRLAYELVERIRDRVEANQHRIRRTDRPHESETASSSGLTYCPDCKDPLLACGCEPSQRPPGDEASPRAAAWLHENVLDKLATGSKGVAAIIYPGRHPGPGRLGPLYPQATIDRLTSERDEARERAEKMEAERDAERRSGEVYREDRDTAEQEAREAKERADGLEGRIFELLERIRELEARTACPKVTEEDVDRACRIVAGARYDSECAAVLSPDLYWLRDQVVRLAAPHMAPGGRETGVEWHEVRCDTCGYFMGHSSQPAKLTCDECFAGMMQEEAEPVAADVCGPETEQLDPPGEPRCRWCGKTNRERNGMACTSKDYRAGMECQYPTTEAPGGDADEKGSPDRGIPQADVATGAGPESEPGPAPERERPAWWDALPRGVRNALAYLLDESTQAPSPKPPERESVNGTVRDWVTTRSGNQVVSVQVDGNPMLNAGETVRITRLATPEEADG